MTRQEWEEGKLPLTRRGWAVVATVWVGGLGLVYDYMPLLPWG